MKKLHYAICLCLLFSSLNAVGQYILNEADKQYEAFKYAKAIDLYEQAYKKKATLHAAERLADCYRFNNDYKQAESWYAIAIKMQGSKPENILHYARALQNNSKYAEAKTQYLSYAAADKNVTAAQKDIWANSCDSAIAWMKNPDPIRIDNYKVLNSAQSDWGAVPYMDGTVFTSDRYADGVTHLKPKKAFLRFDTRIDPDSQLYGWTGNDYLHLFFKSGSTDSVHLFPLKTGTDYHVGPVSFTKDGNEMYFSLTRIPRKITRAKGEPSTINIEIYHSKKDSAGNWSAPVAFPYNKVDAYSVSDPFITADGNTIYFSSNMPGGAGGSDIYKCVKTADEWGQPVNLKEVNTTGNERSPAVDKNNTLYFSSDGRVGMGGLDIYSMAPGGVVKNAGYPVNSPQDDFAFSLREAGGIAYLSSDREGGIGSDDVYKVYEREVPATPVAITVIDEKTKEPLENGIVTIVQDGSPAIKTQTDENGKVVVGLDKDSSYKLIVEKSDYHVNEITGDSIGGKPVPLTKIEMNKEIKLDNIYFDFNNFHIRPDAQASLDKLVKLMKSDATIWIVLGSHTDSRGNDAYNMNLSEKRAGSVVAYLIAKGISKNRVSAKGYGETLLLNKCTNGVSCTEAEHQVNRRTEFKIVKY
ncbi:OmpA family protein [Chitinophaga oryziterrae]|uniref:OmpA family protein n=1 Tax=Chitinophaga oryziterrae TaxID=1031224 RepID=A0A6N8J551_9BACT|nr:OmpA family protein [Chitinophaga oryziterrae]MVT40044.1 OmpA family protein [Chitinophaga oryziterrae]